MNHIVHLVYAEVLKRKEKKHMKTLIKAICGLYFIIFFTTTTFSEEPIFELVQIPVACGPEEQVNLFLNNKGLEPVSISLGKEGSKENAKPVFLITHWEDAKKTKAAATLQAPFRSIAHQICIVYISFDLTKTKMGKGI